MVKQLCRTSNYLKKNVAGMTITCNATRALNKSRDNEVIGDIGTAIYVNVGSAGAAYDCFCCYGCCYCYLHRVLCCHQFFRGVCSSSCCLVQFTFKVRDPQEVPVLVAFKELVHICGVAESKLCLYVLGKLTGLLL